MVEATQRGLVCRVYFFGTRCTVKYRCGFLASFVSNKNLQPPSCMFAIRQNDHRLGYRESRGLHKFYTENLLVLPNSHDTTATHSFL